MYTVGVDAATLLARLLYAALQLKLECTPALSVRSKISFLFTPLSVMGITLSSLVFKLLPRAPAVQCRARVVSCRPEGCTSNEKQRSWSRGATS